MYCPTPQFYVIYNGERETEDRILLRLSDAYFTSNEQIRSEFEWTATMLNINQGHNAVLLKACRPLREYQEFVTLVRDGQTVHHLSLSAAINAALEEAISRNFLNGLFKKLRREIVDILTKEYTEEEMKKLFYEDGMEEGRADGFALGHAEGFAQGRAEGREEGREEGLAEGRAEGRAEALAEIERLKAQIAQLTAK